MPLEHIGYFKVKKKYNTGALSAFPFLPESQGKKERLSCQQGWGMKAERTPPPTKPVS